MRYQACLLAVTTAGPTGRVVAEAAKCAGSTVTACRATQPLCADLPRTPCSGRPRRRATEGVAGWLLRVGCSDDGPVQPSLPVVWTAYYGNYASSVERVRRNAAGPCNLMLVSLT